MQETSSQSAQTSWLFWKKPVFTILFFFFFSFALLQYNRTPLHEIALLQGTLSVTNSKVAGHYVRNDVTSLSTTPNSQYWKALLPSAKQSQFLFVWIGNSHLHTINGMKDGEEVSSTLLHRQLNGERWPGKYPVFGLSYANLNAAEQFLLVLWLLRAKSLPKKLFIINGWRFWDTRMMGAVRPELQFLLQEPAVDSFLQQASLEKKYPDAFEFLKAQRAEHQEQIRKEKTFEARLQNTLGGWIPVYRHRAQLNANIRILLTRTRNVVFGINESTTRRSLGPRYKLSLTFFEMTSLLCKQASQHMLLYNVPLRPDSKNPYKAAEYQAFQMFIQQVKKKYPLVIHYKNYDSLIPVEHWGTFYDTKQADFSHFKFEGHKILAKEVGKDLADFAALRMLPTFSLQKKSTSFPSLRTHYPSSRGFK